MAMRDDYWDEARVGHGWNIAAAGMGALRVTLLFGSAAVALALVLAPVAENQVRAMYAQGPVGGLDTMATGTVGQHNAGASYTVRRSVLQATPVSVCIIRANGSRSGDC